MHKTITQSIFSTSLTLASTTMGSQNPSEAQPEMLRSLLGWDTRGHLTHTCSMTPK